MQTRKKGREKKETLRAYIVVGYIEEEQLHIAFR
jgi:hypothetical protein